MSVEGSVGDLDDEASLTSVRKVGVKIDGVPDTEEVSRVESISTAPNNLGNRLGLISLLTLGLQTFVIGEAGPVGCFKT